MFINFSYQWETTLTFESVLELMTRWMNDSECRVDWKIFILQCRVLVVLKIELLNFSNGQSMTRAMEKWFHSPFSFVFICFYFVCCCVFHSLVETAVNILSHKSIEQLEFVTEFTVFISSNTYMRQSTHSLFIHVDLVLYAMARRLFTECFHVYRK